MNLSRHLKFNRNLKYNFKKHINHSAVPKILTMKHLGFDGDNRFALTEPFKMFTDEAVDHIRDLTNDEDFNRKCQRKAPFASYRVVLVKFKIAKLVKFRIAKCRISASQVIWTRFGQFWVVLGQKTHLCLKSRFIQTLDLTWCFIRIGPYSSEMGVILNSFRSFLALSMSLQNQQLRLTGLYGTIQLFKRHVRV